MRPVWKRAEVLREVLSRPKRDLSFKTGLSKRKIEFGIHRCERAPLCQSLSRTFFRTCEETNPFPVVRVGFAHSHQCVMPLLTARLERTPRCMSLDRSRTPELLRALPFRLIVAQPGKRTARDQQQKGREDAPSKREQDASITQFRSGKLDLLCGPGPAYSLSEAPGLGCVGRYSSIGFPTNRTMSASATAPKSSPTQGEYQPKAVPSSPKRIETTPTVRA